MKSGAAGCRGGAPLVTVTDAPDNSKNFKKFFQFLGTDSPP